MSRKHKLGCYSKTIVREDYGAYVCVLNSMYDWMTDKLVDYRVEVYHRKLPPYMGRRPERLKRSVSFKSIEDAKERIKLELVKAKING